MESRLSNKQIIEIVSALAVVASLIFVGMQLMLDRRAALSEQYASRAESSKADFRTRLESDYFIPYRVSEWERGVRPYFWTEEIDDYVKSRQLSGSDVWTIILTERINYYQIDNIYYQYLNGFIEDEFWSGMLTTIENNLRDPLTRAVLTSMGEYHPIDRVISEILNGVNET